MLDGDLFDKLAKIASLLRKNNDPFGGIQVCTTFLFMFHLYGIMDRSLSLVIFSSFLLSPKGRYK